MNYKAQYEKDVAYIARIDNVLSKKVEFLAYFVALVACLAAHAMYFVLFSACGIKEMAIFNVGSVTFYAITIVLVRLLRSSLCMSRFQNSRSSSGQEHRWIILNSSLF